MASFDALVKPELLKWARVSTHLDIEEAARAAHVKPEKLMEAERGTATITYKQLQSLASACRIPLRVLYLDEPPSEESAPVDFRRLRGGPKTLTSDIITILRVARERRATILELSSDLALDIPTMPAAGDRESIISILTPLFCTQYWSQGPFDWHASGRALTITKENVERKLPILVFEFTIESADLRGCALFDKRLSAVVISSDQPSNARRFSLAHEIVHLLLRQSGLCNPAPGSSNSGDEQLCDEIASESLLPTALLEGELPVLSRLTPEAAALKLARKFGISQSAAVFRLYQADQVTRHDLNRLLRLYENQWRAHKEQQREKSGSLGAHKLQVYRLGPTFTTKILDAIEADLISPSRGAALLGVKPSYQHFDSVREHAMNVYGG